MTEYLLAHVADQLAEANWMFATVNRDEDADPLEYPEPVARPGETPAVATPTPSRTVVPNPSEIAQFFSE